MRMRIRIRIRIKLNSVSSITCNVSNSNNNKSNNPLSATKMCRSFLVKKDRAKNTNCMRAHKWALSTALRLKFMKTEKKSKNRKEKRNICPQSCWWLLMWYYNECDRQEKKTIWPILVSNADNISIASIIFAPKPKTVPDCNTGTFHAEVFMSKHSWWSICFFALSPCLSGYQLSIKASKIARLSNENNSPEGMTHFWKPE